MRAEAALSGVRAASSATNFAALLLIAGILDSGDFAVWATGLALSGLVASIGYFGTDVAFSLRRLSIEDYLNCCRLLSAAAAVLGLSATALYPQLTPPERSISCILAACVALDVYRSPVLVLAHGAGDVRARAASEALFRLSTTLAQLLGALIFGLIGLTVATVLVFVCTALTARPLYRMSATRLPPLHAVSKCLRYTTPALLFASYTTLPAAIVTANAAGSAAGQLRIAFAAQIAAITVLSTLGNESLRFRHQNAVRYGPLVTTTIVLALIGAAVNWVLCVYYLGLEGLAAAGLSINILGTGIAAILSANALIRAPLWSLPSAQVAAGIIAAIFAVGQDGALNLALALTNAQFALIVLLGTTLVVTRQSRRR